MSTIPGIDPSAPPSGTGCVECLETDEYYDGAPQLAEPDSHPLDQPVPAPAGRVPSNWQELLNQ